MQPDKVFDVGIASLIGGGFGYISAFVTSRVKCGVHDQKLKSIEEDKKTILTEINALKECMVSVKDSVKDMGHGFDLQLAKVLDWRYTSQITDNYKDPKKESLRCLIVEDREENADIFKKLFHQVHIDSVIVSSYKDAISAVDDFRYDLVLADYDLGEMRTGIDFWHYCSVEYPRLPVIVYSGRTTEDLLIPPSMKFIEKPVKHKVLFNIIEECGIKLS